MSDASYRWWSDEKEFGVVNDGTFGLELSSRAESDANIEISVELCLAKMGNVT
jgi:hypothetical protein